MTNTYEFTPEMREISGFGGGYEATCRAMLKAGMEWFDAHPDADPRYKGFRNVYGLIYPDNEDANALDAAILNAAGGNATGAMHQAVVQSCLFIRKNGWEKYVTKMTESSEGEGA